MICHPLCGRAFVACIVQADHLQRCTAHPACSVMPRPVLHELQHFCVRLLQPLSASLVCVCAALMLCVPADWVSDLLCFSTWHCHVTLLSPAAHGPLASSAMLRLGSRHSVGLCICPVRRPRLPATCACLVVCTWKLQAVAEAFHDMKGALLGAAVVLALVAHSSGAQGLNQCLCAHLLPFSAKIVNSASDRTHSPEAEAERKRATHPWQHQPAADAVILGRACDGRDPPRPGVAAPARDPSRAAAWAVAGARAGW